MRCATARIWYSISSTIQSTNLKLRSKTEKQHFEKLEFMRQRKVSLPSKVEVDSDIQKLESQITMKSMRNFKRQQKESEKCLRPVNCLTNIWYNESMSDVWCHLSQSTKRWEKLLQKLSIYKLFLWRLQDPSVMLKCLTSYVIRLPNRALTAKDEKLPLVF